MENQENLKNRENQTVKYYGLTFSQSQEKFKDWECANDFIRVVKIFGDNCLVVYKDAISTDVKINHIFTSEGSEISREQFDDFYKKIATKINEAANV